MLFVQFVGMTAASAYGSPHQKFTCSDIYTAEDKFVTPYKV